MSTIRWHSKLASVAGRHAPKIEKAFDYTTVGELLRHYPRRYVPKGGLSDLGRLVVDEHVTVIAQVLSAEQRPYRDRRTGQQAYRLEVVVATGDHELMLTFFDKKKHIADWRRRNIAPGSHGVFSGKIGRFRNNWQLTNPQTQLFADDLEEDGHERARESWERQPNLLTLYPASASVQSWQLQKAIHLALDLVEDVPEPLPP
ncbi:MAG TPA: ATP-dependent DNA helicase RecG, partial [Nocardioidaceae bacterium]